jgi:hypothetical protein
MRLFPGRSSEASAKFKALAENAGVCLSGKVCLVCAAGGFTTENRAFRREISKNPGKTPEKVTGGEA